MVRTDTRIVGADAEYLAEHFLLQKGLTPVQRNFRCRLGELDLIMQDGRCLVVVEVRSRNSKSFVPARLTIDRRKQQKIVRTAALFLAWHERFSGYAVRFDVVGIDVDASGAATIDWLRDAFRPANANL